MLCGHGNNGGDGYVVARLAKAIGIDVTLLAQSDKPLPEEAALAREAWLNAGGEIHASNIVWPESVDLIVDALLGTGLQQAPRESISQLIDHANSHPAPIVAVDIPSGLLAETGATPRGNQRRSHHHFYCAETSLLTGKARMLPDNCILTHCGWIDGWQVRRRKFSGFRQNNFLSG